MKKMKILMKKMKILMKILIISMKILIILIIISMTKKIYLKQSPNRKFHLKFRIFHLKIQKCSKIK